MNRWGTFFRSVLTTAISCATLAGSVTPASAGGDPRFGEQWGLSVVRAPEAWGAGTGAGITIAVVDTGVDFGHRDLNVDGKLLAGHNVLDPNKGAQDDHGHGTHVAGIAAAATGNGIGIAGTAPDASILPVKVLDAEGSGYASDVATGIRWAAGEGAGAPRAHVVNLSLGSDLPPLATLFGSGLEEAIDYAWSRGVVVVLAAGNSFLFASSSGRVPAIVVTATTRQDERAGYASAVGSAKWGMAAPGGSSTDSAGGIISTYLPNGYKFLAGTSMSAPHVAGAAAVLRGMGLTPQQTVDRLLDTAKDLGEPGRDSTFGRGRLDLACAIGRCGSSAPTDTGTQTDPGPQPQTSSSPSTGSEGVGGTAGPEPAAGARSAGGTGAGSRAARNRPAGFVAAPAGPAAATPGLPQPAAGSASEVPRPQPVDDTTSEEPPAERSLSSLNSARRGMSEERADPLPAAAAAGLLLLVAFSGFGLRRRRRHLLP